MVATVDEPVALLAAFVAHHLAMGAREVHLFLDRPDQDALAVLGGIKGVFLALSGEDGAALPWARTGGVRPARHQMRQAYNANTVLERAAHTPDAIAYLAHVDADEFITPAEGGLIDFARDEADFTPEQVWIRLRVEERAHALPFSSGGMFEGLFRRPWVEFEGIGEELYGPSARFLQLGISAHAAGKAVARVGAGQALGVHRVVSGPGIAAGDWGGPKRDGRMTSRHAIVRHFDGITPLHFLLKLLRRGVNAQVIGANYPPARLAQYREAAARIADVEGLWALWDAVQGVRDDVREVLEELMGGCPTPCDIEATARLRFPALAFDAAAFDRALLAREGAVFAQLAALGFNAEAYAAN